jgi:arylsulfatase A-like enzyme
MSDQPNFLVFSTDQQQADDLGGLGNTFIQTPNLDQLISEGVVFSNAFATHPVCTPARMSMFTGRYPSNLSYYAHTKRNPHGGMSLDTNTVAFELQQAGYCTGGYGKFHLNKCEIWAKEDNVSTEEYAKQGKAIPDNYFGFEHRRLSARHREIMNWEHAADIAEHAPEVFEKAGPENALEEPTGAWQSWKSAVPEEWYSTTWIADQTIDFLKNKRDKGKPFFAFCSFPDPHHPMSPPSPWCDMYAPEDVPLPRRREGELADLPEWSKDFMPVDRPETTGAPHGPDAKGYVHSEEFMQEVRALTYGMISLIDKHCGRVIDTLKQENVMDNTIIIFICDHGDYMGDHWLVGKGVLHYDSITRIPHFWWAPKGRFTQQVSDALVSQIDLMPTMLELAGVDIPIEVQGRSLKSILEGSSSDVRDDLLIEDDGWGTPYIPRTIRTKDFRLTRWYTKDTHKLGDRGELFDLRKDPYELHNIYDDHPDTVQQLTEQLLALQIEVTMGG